MRKMLFSNNSGLTSPKFLAIKITRTANTLATISRRSIRDQIMIPVHSYFLLTYAFKYL